MKKIYKIVAIMMSAALLLSGMMGTQTSLLSETLNATAYAADSEETTADQLRAVCEQINALNESDYTEESWSEFQEAISAYSTVFDNLDSLDSNPEAANAYILSALQAALELLVEAEEEEEETTADQLRAVCEQINALNESDYTAESWSEFQEAISAYSTVFDNLDSLDSNPEAANAYILSALQAALELLVVVSENDDDAGTDTDDGDDEGTSLSDGVYRAELSYYLNPEHAITQNSVINVKSRLWMNPYASLQCEDGIYTVTLRIRNYDKLAYFGILDSDYDDYLTEDGEVNDEATDYRYLSGTKGWLDSSVITKYSDKIQAGYSESYDTYWLNYTIEKNEEEGYWDISFEVKDLNDDIRFYYSYASSSYTMSFGCLVLNTQTMEEIDLEEAKAKTETDYTAYYSNSFASFFSDFTASWNVTDDTAEATFTYELTATNADNYSVSSVIFYDLDGNTLDADGTSSFTLTYDLSDTDDLAFGITISYELSYTRLSTGKDYTGTGYITLIPTGSLEQVILTEDTTGLQLITYNTIVPATATLTVSEIEDDENDSEDPYDIITNNLGTNNENLYMYYWELQYSDGTTATRTSKDVTLRFKIPEDWDADNVQLFAYYVGYGYDPDVEGTVETDEDGTSYFVISTTWLGYYALYEVKTTSDADEDMADGTYTIPISVYNLTKEGQLSMANQCLCDTAILTVVDGVKTLYLTFESVAIYGEESYMTRMWLYGEDMEQSGSTITGTLNQVIYTSYYTDEDGNFLTDSFNEGTLNYYPSAGYIVLVSDSAKWPVRFKVPVMDAVGGGSFEQDAWLTIYWDDAELISETVEDRPIRTALAALISVKESGVESQYTAETWSVVEEAYEEALSVYNTEDASEDELTAVYVALQTAINNLEEASDSESDTDSDTNDTGTDDSDTGDSGTGDGDSNSVATITIDSADSTGAVSADSSLSFSFEGTYEESTLSVYVNNTKIDSSNYTVETADGKTTVTISAEYMSTFADTFDAETYTLVVSNDDGVIASGTFTLVDTEESTSDESDEGDEDSADADESDEGDEDSADADESDDTGDEVYAAENAETGDTAPVIAYILALVLCIAAVMSAVQRRRKVVK